MKTSYFLVAIIAALIGAAAATIAGDYPKQEPFPVEMKRTGAVDILLDHIPYCVQSVAHYGNDRVLLSGVQRGVCTTERARR